MSSEGSGTAGTATIGIPAKRLLALALPVLLWACSTLLPSAVFAQATCGPPFFSCPTDQQCVVFEGECRHNPGLAGEICGLADPCASNLQCTGGRCAARRQAGQSCTGFGQGSCQSGLLCDARGVCRNDPPRLGQPCGAGVACTDGLSCSALVGGVCTEALVAGDRCEGLGQGNCGSGLVCDARGVCRNDPPRLGQPCGAGVACTDGLSCSALVGGVCTEALVAGDRCEGLFQGNCGSGLVCDVSGECRHSPPESGEPCGVGVACATGYACDALVDGRCQEPARIGEPCFGLGRGNCQIGAACQIGVEADGGTASRCFPSTNDPLGVSACSRAYSPLLSRLAMVDDATLTFGLAGGAEAFAAGSIETGVAYGQNGEFGCFVSRCSGVASDVSIGVSVCNGSYTGFQSVAGESTAIVTGASTPVAEIGYSVGAIVGSNGTDAGTSSCFSIGLGASPADIGLFNCTTEVLEVDLDSNGDGMNDVDVAVLSLDPTAPGGDTDRDGVPDVEEIGGDVERPADIDGDGVIDALESGTAAADAAVAENVPLGGGRSVTVRADDGELLSAVGGSPGDGTAPADVTATYGVVGYRSTAPVGGSVTVTLSFDDTLPEGLSLFTLDYAGDVTALVSSVWSRVDARTVAITSTDGDGATDLDGTPDGSVNLLVGIGTTLADDGGVTEGGDTAEGGNVTEESVTDGSGAVDGGSVGGGAGAVVDDATGAGGGGGGGCSVGGGRRDPSLPLLGLGALGWFLLRRRTERGSARAD